MAEVSDHRRVYNGLTRSLMPRAGLAACIFYALRDQGELSTLQATLESNVKEIVITRAAEKRMFETCEFKQDAAGRAQEVVVYTPDSAFVVSRKL
jgi:hypothetical protein